MKITPWLLAATLGVVCSHASAQKTIPTKTLCAASEEPVFACTLEGRSHKMVALCALPAATPGTRSFYYAYGRPSKIELKYPASGNGDEAFTRTPLHLGALVGYAFAFTNEGYKYILYSTEGIRDARVGDSGLMVQRAGQMNVDRDMHCKASTLVETKSQGLWDATSKWKVDADIEVHNLPRTN